jgi:hypothetical protein
MGKQVVRVFRLLVAGTKAVRGADVRVDLLLR